MSGGQGSSTPAHARCRSRVVLTATNTMIAELAQDWSRPGGMELLQIPFTEVLPPIKPAV